ncbi:hypothetical protein, partial [Plasmodium yoelii yoelii]
MNLKNIYLYICFNIKHKQRHKTQILYKYKKLRKLLLESLKYILISFNIYYNKLKNNFNALNNFIFISTCSNLEVFSIG